jgi:catechol 2,3-dioxygenase-like lactoylglutathione lyase family enzyme
VDHINIIVSDLEKSVNFYTEMLGFKEIKRAHLEGDWIESIVGLKGVEADVAYILAPEGEPRIELLCYKTPRGMRLPHNSSANTVGLRHIAFRVNDIHNLYKKLLGNGVKFIGEPVVVPQSVISHDAGQKVLCYFTDPDGVLLEFAEYS